VKQTYKNILEYYGFRLIEITVKILPLFAIQFVANFLAFITFKVIKLRRQVALENLSLAFPEKTKQQRFNIAYQSYIHFAQVLIEFMKFSSWSIEKIEKRVFIEKPELFDIIMQGNKDKGMIFVSGHLGNWEIPIIFLAAKNVAELTVIQQRQRNHLVDRHLSNIRGRRGMKILYTGDAISNALVDLKQKRLVAIVCDQDAGKRGVFVPFFGRMAATPVGASLLHLQSKARLVFACSVRTGQLRYKGIMIPIEYRGDYSINKENMAIITGKFTSILEDLVRQYPEQYLWGHRRWKTKFVPEK
jgi:KDO2-lipid IV(A) lauroyltransferase